MSFGSVEPLKKWHALNNDHSHRVFIYVLKRRLCSHFPALLPCTDDKVGKASARWRRGVIYNHINPFTFHTGLGHCHFCPRGESHNPTYSTNNFLLISGMMNPTFTFIPDMVMGKKTTCIPLTLEHRHSSQGEIYIIYSTRYTTRKA